MAETLAATEACGRLATTLPPGGHRQGRARYFGCVAAPRPGEARPEAAAARPQPATRRATRAGWAGRLPSRTSWRRARRGAHGGARALHSNAPSPRFTPASPPSALKSLWRQTAPADRHRTLEPQRTGSGYAKAGAERLWVGLGEWRSCEKAFSLTRICRMRSRVGGCLGPGWAASPLPVSFPASHTRT